MTFIWPELEGDRKHLDKPIGSKLCGMKRNKRRPAKVSVSQAEVDSYPDWENYEKYLRKHLRI